MARRRDQVRDETATLLYQSNIQQDEREKPSIFEHVPRSWPEYESKSTTMFLFFVSLVGGAAVAVAIVYANDYWGTWNTATWVAHCLSFIPMLTLQLFLGTPQATVHFTEWLQQFPGWIQIIFFPSLITLCWLFSCVILQEFNPLALAYVFFMSCALVGTLKQVRDSKGDDSTDGLTWADVGVWLLFWIPIDLRWIYVDIWFGSGLAYDWFASAASLLLVVGFGIFRKLEGFSYRLIPHWKDIVAGISVSLMFWVIVTPLGLVAGFLEWQGFDSLWHRVSAQAFFSNFGEILLTVAITEELFFRAILFNGLHQLLKEPYPRYGKWIAWVSSSLCFGLMHWPRMNGLVSQISYVAFAFLAGLFYCGAYLATGNILGGVISHVLTDTLWNTVFPQ